MKRLRPYYLRKVGMRIFNRLTLWCGWVAYLLDPDEWEDT